MKRRVQQRNDDEQPTAGSALAAGGASAVGGALGTAGGMTLTSCPSDDTSFYCKFVRAFNMFKMIIFVVAFLILVYVLYSMWASQKKGTTIRRGRK